jgi:hypothetical protein
MRTSTSIARRLLHPLAATLALAVLATSARAQEDAASTRGQVAPRPKAPVVVQRACPFECCRYGRWTLVEPAVVRRRPSPSAPAAFRLPAGTGVFADTGFVRIDTIGLVVLLEPHFDQANRIQYAPGDSILVLDYLGEMVTNAWFRGRRIQTPTFWEPADRGIARVERDVSMRWWARVRDRRGRRGWIDMSTTDVHGADACST